MLNLIPALILLILQGPTTSEAQVPSWQVRALVQHAVMLSQSPVIQVAFKLERRPKFSFPKFVQEVSESKPVDRFPEPKATLCPGHCCCGRSRDGPAH